MTPILVALVIIGIVLFVLIAGRPDEFTVVRSATIAAPPEEVFSHVNELRKWDAWSPWAKLDPNAKNSFAGPAAGVGSTMSWSGNNKVGEGRMTITGSRASEVIQFKLEFLRPFKATNTAEFKFTAADGRTLVAWSMFGKNNFMSKMFSLIVDCDKMVGKDFEKGLASLKTIIETTKSQP